ISSEPAGPEPSTSKTALSMRGLPGRSAGMHGQRADLMRTPFNGYGRLAAAFVRGQAIGGWPITLSEALCRGPLEDLTREELNSIIEAGLNAGLRLHGFKRTAGLPRVVRVIGMLRGLLPDSLLDLGSGR